MCVGWTSCSTYIQLPNHQCTKDITPHISHVHSALISKSHSSPINPKPSSLPEPTV